MNGLHRRLLKAFVQSGGDLGEGADLDRFATLVRTNVLLLTSRTRRAVELVLEGGEEISYETIAERLTAQEGRRVSVASVRQRVSRGGRHLERAVRRAAMTSSSPDAGAPPTLRNAPRDDAPLAVSYGCGAAAPGVR
jgi:hypothetical protein